MNFRSKTVFTLGMVAVVAIPATFLAGSANGATPETLNAYTTGYSWYDNTPPGSSAVSAELVTGILQR